MKSLTKKQIDQILIMPDSYERFREFLKISDYCKRKNYWYALRFAYGQSDNLFEHKNEVKKAFLLGEPFRESIMDKDERNFLNKLPDIITIYRGMTSKEFHSKDYGISWTLNPKVAIFFAHEYIRNHATKNMPKKICEMKISKQKVIAYINGRNEQEIIYVHNIN
jgi:hypothetical protein